ncbi:unnamed protein product [Arctogadus glacialis]
MLSSLLRSALLLAAVCCLTYAEKRVITCGDKIQRLSCDEGMISVLKVAYGWTDKKTCKEEKPSDQLANTAGALEALANRCNGTKVCEVDKEIFGDDPCPDTYKYIQTTYTCLPARQEEVIKVIRAFYGRNDRTTCPGNPGQAVNQVNCFSTTATSTVAKSCDGKRNCTVHASNSVFGNPCGGILKYLEVAYTCDALHLMNES